jgi:hypothetical protein
MLWRGAERWVVIGLVLAASLLIPQSATARVVNPTFSVEASNGYLLKVRGVASRRTERVTMTLERGDVSAEYSVDATEVSGRRVQADLGPFGAVDVAFEPRGKPSADVFDCVEQKGVFTGTISFAGENGFAEVSTNRAKGKVATKKGGGLCVSFYPKAQHESDLTFLTSCVPATGTTYVALAGLGSRPAHLARQEDRVGAVTIRRAAFLSRGKKSSFTFSKDFDRARLSPDGAFSGSAKYAGGRLTGDLAVELPGVTDAVSLAPAIAGLLGPGRVPRPCRALGLE